MSNRRTGKDNELAFAKAIGGTKISQTGKAGADVLDPYGDEWEVKRRKNMTLDLWKFIDQARRQGGFRVAIKRPYKEWLVVMPLKEYLEWRENG